MMNKISTTLQVIGAIVIFCVIAIALDQLFVVIHDWVMINLNSLVELVLMSVQYSLITYMKLEDIPINMLWKMAYLQLIK